MDLHAVARALLAIFCAIQGAATIALDLNRTHAAHPQWLGHARFHVVWQTATAAALAAFEVFVLYFGNTLEAERFYLAAILACFPMFGFFAALAFRSIYGGTLHDARGIPPLVLMIGGRHRSIDLNLVAVIAGIVTVAGIVALYRLS